MKSNWQPGWPKATFGQMFGQALLWQKASKLQEAGAQA
jgi:hypothetical protein